MDRAKLDKDLKELSTYSQNNLERWQDAVGEAALKLVDGLVKKYTANLQLSLSHETKNENIDAIKEDGFVYSYDALVEKKKNFKSGITVTGEATANSIFINVKHDPDPYTEFVYSYPCFGGPGRTPLDGFIVTGQKLNPEMWMSFIDRNKIMEGDKEAMIFGISVSTGFCTGDVFIAEHIREALVLKTLMHMTQARCLQRMNNILYDAIDKEYKAAICLPPDKDLKMDFEETLKKHILRPDISSDMKDNLVNRHYEGLHGKVYRDAGLDVYKRGYDKLPVLDESFLRHRDFDRWFSATLGAVLKDLSKEGQIAIPEKIDIRGAEVFRGGKKQQMTKGVLPKTKHASPQKHL